MFKHLYQNPSCIISLAEGNQVSDEEIKNAVKHLEQFYEEIFLELSNFGELKDLFVLDNLCDHLIGNVYAKFCDEKAAKNAFDSLQGKYYHSDLVDEEYCPIINVKDGKCYKYEDGLCNKGPYCNFFHFKDINIDLIKSLKNEQYEIHPEYRKNRFNNNNNKNYSNKKRTRRHEHTSSESSLGRYDKFTRKRIIHRWNDEYISNKKIEEKRKLMDKLERHRRHKHHKKHKHYRSDSENYDKSDKYDNKYEKLNKKKYEEDIILNESQNAQDKITEKSKSQSNPKKQEKNIVKNIDNSINKENNKSQEKSISKEIKIDSDEEETISAGEFEQKNN